MQFFGVQPIPKRQRATRAQADIDMASIMQQGTRQAAHDGVDGFLFSLFRCQSWQDDRELVPAQTRQCGADRQTFGQFGRHVMQHRIARMMAQRVVDGLEPVDIQHDQANTLPLSARLVQRLVQALGKHRAIGQPGQGIMRRRPFELGLILQLRGDVMQRAQQTDRLAILVAHDIAPRNEVEIAPIGRAKSELFDPLVEMRVLQACQIIDHALLIVRMDMVDPP